MFQCIQKCCIRMPINIIRKINHYNSFNHKFNLFDVSLRDGMQGLSTKEQQKYTTDAKFELYKKIINIHHVKDIEIGSLVNPNIMPIMNDTLKLHDKIIRYNELYHISDINPYVLVGNKKYFTKAFNSGVRNFSFLSSISNEFQKKNCRKTIEDTKNELEDIFTFLSSTNIDNYHTKIYISCVNECPVSGNRISLATITREIVWYLNNFPNTKICISDTCASLTFSDYEHIISQILFLYSTDIENLSLHLHVNHNNIDNVNEILLFSRRMKIRSIDVSILNTGGCNITLTEDKIFSNLHYKDIHKLFTTG